MSGWDGRIVVATALCGVALIAFGLSHVLWLSILILPVVGFGMMQQMAPSNTILQTIVDDEKRGRVMSFYSMAFQGMVPFGSLLPGTWRRRSAAPRTMMLNGRVCLWGSSGIARRLPAIRKVVRPIYVQRGFLPPALHSQSDDVRGRGIGVEIFNQRGAIAQDGLLVDGAFVGNFVGVHRQRVCQHDGAHNAVRAAGAVTREFAENFAEATRHINVTAALPCRG